MKSILFCMYGHDVNKFSKLVQKIVSPLNVFGFFKYDGALLLVITLPNNIPAVLAHHRRVSMALVMVFHSNNVLVKAFTQLVAYGCHIFRKQIRVRM